MQLFTKSYVFQNIINRNGTYAEKIKNMLMTNDKKNVSKHLSRQLRDMMKIYKDTLVAKAVHEIQLKNMNLYILPPELMLPQALPFVKYINNGEKMFIDVSRYIKEKTIDNEIEYDIDIKQLYVLVVSSYITLKLVNENSVPSINVLKYSSIIWSKMFCKVLNNLIGLSTDKDKYYAYMYMCMKFFLLKFMDTPQQVAENICSAYVGEFYQGKKEMNYYLTNMLNVIDARQYTPFENLKEFCYTMFADDVGNTSGITIANVSDKLNVSVFFKKYMTMFGPAAVMSLSSFSYLIMTILAAKERANMVNDRAMDDIIKDDAQNVIKLLNALIKDLK